VPFCFIRFLHSSEPAYIMGSAGLQSPWQGAGFVGKLAILKELWGFLRARKKWWLLPIVGMLVLMAGLVLLTEGSAIAPFIYALF
jgi:hypothetical protein